MIHSTTDIYKSWLLKRTNHATERITPLIRGEFAETPWSQKRDSSTHSHPSAAAERNAVANFATNLGLRTGLTPFFLQMANADQKAGYDGSRAVFWGKDLTINTQNDAVLPHHLLVAVDDDYHMNIHSLLLKTNNPVLLYTIAPTVPAGKVKDGYFRFDSGEFEMRVKGGAVFRHKLWDYGPDCVTVSGWVWKRLRPRYRTKTYLVERRNLSEHRQLVLLVPIGKHMYAAGWLAKRALQTAPLERMDPRQRGFNVIRSIGDEHEVAISRDGAYTSAKVSASTLDGLLEVAIRAATAKNRLTIASVESHLPPGPGRKESAEILTAYLMEATKADFASGATYVHPVSLGVARYQFKPESYDPEARPGLTSFMSPLIGGAPAPDLTRANDEQTVKGRLTDVKPPNIEPTDFHLRIVREFIKHLIPVPGICIPGTYEENFERQPRPSQQRILAEADNNGDHYNRTFKAFQKKEAMGKLGDPRNITTICGSDKATYSTYMYAFMDAILKQQEWYAFGKTPVEIATIVARICECSVDGVALGDLSRQDGRTGPLMRALEDAMMLRAFPPSVHDHMVKTMRTQRNQPARTSMGVKYNSGDSRASGSPETSPFNTVENAFIAYKAMRMTPIDGQFMSPERAWATLETVGLFGGDDSIIGDFQISSYSRAASSVGHVATGEFVQRGERGVNFLARYYSPGVWCGATDSMCDIKRALWKFHTCANLPDTVKPEQKLVEKAISVEATDGQTPIFCDLVDAVRRVRGRVKPSEGDTSWWYSEDKTSRYPNTKDDWMDDEVALALPELDTGSLSAYLQSATSLKQLLNIPVFMASLLEPPAPAVDVVVNGEVVLAKDADEPVDGPPMRSDAQDEDGADAAETTAANAPKTKRRKPRKRKGTKKRTTRRAEQNTKPDAPRT